MKLIIPFALIAIGAIMLIGGSFAQDTDTTATDTATAQAVSDRVGGSNIVHLITVESAIHAVVTESITRAIERADEEDAEALIIMLDTPGGLLESTHDITKTLLNSPVPICVYVAPDGARAGSAGVFITMAAHVAAMAPSTNIGAATPVGLGGAPEDTSEGSQSDTEAMRKKVTNDAVAGLRAMAEKHGRNADWAEQAVREAVSITASEALEKNVVEIVAEDVEDLLDQMDGMIVDVSGEEVTLDTADAAVVEYEPTWREDFLNTLANPNLAYILMLIGFYGLIFELYNPGVIIPGVVGVICLILAFFALQTLPISWAGLLLLIVAMVMFVLEIYVTSFGFLTFGGAVALIIGSILLFDTEVPALQVSWSVIIPTVLVTVAFFAFALTMAVRAQKKKVSAGLEALVGELGKAVSELNPHGKVKIGGEYWKAEAEDGPIKAGDSIVVISAERLIVKVKRAD